MLSRNELLAYLDDLLDVRRYDDYAPNGLQIEGVESVRTVVSGVTASRALVEAAVRAEADALLVHHGYFWRGEDPRIVGMKRARLAPLLAHNINLFAYHLPLDAHEVYGNNAQLARVLGLIVQGRFGGEPPLALCGELSVPVDAEEFALRIERGVGRAPLFISGGTHAIRRIGWCTGAAQKYIDAAAALGLDAYISGEVSEHTVHAARELGIHYFAAGHHATERYGVAALGDHLAQRFGVTHLHLDLSNPA